MASRAEAPSRALPPATTSGPRARGGLGDALLSLLAVCVALLFLFPISLGVLAIPARRSTTLHDAGRHAGVTVAARRASGVRWAPQRESRLRDD